MANVVAKTSQPIEAPDLATLLQPLHSGQWVAFSHDYSKVLASGNSVANLLKKLSDEEKASDPIFYKVPDQHSYYIPIIR
jgi:hypothetical protein